MQLVIILCLLLPSYATAKLPKPCESIQQKIDKVQSQLRAGYTEPRGNRLRKQRRELNDRLRKCKRNN